VKRHSATTAQICAKVSGFSFSGNPGYRLSTQVDTKGAANFGRQPRLTTGAIFLNWRLDAPKLKRRKTPVFTGCHGAALLKLLLTFTNGRGQFWRARSTTIPTGKNRSF
jgi:hypothetical protein